MSESDRIQVYHYLLEDVAERDGDRRFLLSDDETLSYGETNMRANRIAAGFAALGVAKGERVLMMLPGGTDFIVVWLGLCKIGAIAVPVNEAHRGQMLAHVVRETDAVAAVIDPAYAERWREIGEASASLKTVIAYADDPGALGGIGGAARVSFDELPRGDGADPPPVVSGSDPMAILYTSGTTGPSKGVLYGYRHAYATALPLARMCGPDDVFYFFLPMFHTGLPHVFGTALISGAALIVRRKFSATGFWEDVRRFGATVTLLLSTMPAYLMAQPPDSRDRDHTLNKIFMTPLTKDLESFKARFGCEKIATLYNMTEVSTPLLTDFDLVDAASCGRPRPGIEARIVDENDEVVPPGEPGELVLRSHDPWEFNLGYWRQPEKTAEAWRNQWLHTGDMLLRDEDSNFYFKDRLKDAIRRRGENISSYELENEVKACPGIAECAAVGVESDMGEQEVKISATVHEDAGAFDPAELIRFLKPRIPAYMLPRYVELRDELPRTPTGKVQKMALREAGIDGLWDLETDFTA